MKIKAYNVTRRIEEVEVDTDEILKLLREVAGDDEESLEIINNNDLETSIAELDAEEKIEELLKKKELNIIFDESRICFNKDDAEDYVLYGHL